MSAPTSAPPQVGELSPAVAHWLLVARHGAAPALATADWVANHWRCDDAAVLCRRGLLCVPPAGR